MPHPAKLPCALPLSVACSSQRRCETLVMCTCLGRGEGYKRTLQLGEHRGHVTHSERVRRGMNEAPPAPGFTFARSHRAAVAIAPSTAPSAGSIHGHSEPLNHHRPPILRQRPVHVTQPKVLRAGCATQRWMQPLTHSSYQSSLLANQPCDNLLHLPSCLTVIRVLYCNSPQVSYTCIKDS